MTNSHSRIKGLSCRDEALKRLGAGESFGKVAKFVHEQGEMLDIKPRSLEAALRRFCQDNPGVVLTKDPIQARALEILHGETPKYIQEWQDGFVERLDVLTEMENLYSAQKTRIVRLMLAEQEEAEENSKYVMPQMRAEMKLGFQMARDVANLQMELDYLRRAPIRIDERKQVQTFDIKKVMVEYQGDLLEELKGILPKDKLEEVMGLQEAKLRRMARLELMEEIDSD